MARTLARLLRRCGMSPMRPWFLPLYMIVWWWRGTLRQRLRDVRAARLMAQSGWFDPAYYRTANPDVANGGHDPIWHYTRIGQAELRDPHPDFDVRYYIATNPDARDHEAGALVHYLTAGAPAGRHTRSPLGAPRPREGAGTVAPPAASSNIPAVVLHLFYPELWPEFLRHLRSIEEPFDLYVTVCDEPAHDPLAERVRSDFADATILRLPNRGRDILPFLTILNSGRLSAYPVVCKLHSKRSPHLDNGEQWRRSTLNDLIGSSRQVAAIRRAFDADPRLGILGPASAYYPSDPHSRSNDGHTDDLRRVMSMDGRRTPFFAGSMFWFRPAALAPLAALRLGPDAFEPELGQVDGTLAHAIERMFSAAAVHVGFEIRHTGALDTAVGAAPSGALKPGF